MPTGGKGRSPDRKSVLLVDDDPVFVEAVSAVLESCYRVLSAANGSEAHRALAEELPDLVILDVMMDHLSEGFDVARALRGDPRTEKIPIIMLTGVDRVYNVRMEVEESWMPCERFLEKPISPSDLLDEVRELIG
jgi:CheY-like chemotaxis protein